MFVFDPGEDGSTWRDLEGSVLVTEDDAVHILRGPSCPKTCRFSTGLGSGDFNGDGLEDLVVGAGLANGYSGEVMVYLTEPLR